VLPKYDEFLYTFPTVQMLAKASPAKVLRLWKGMGYNRRALFLHKTAKIVVDEYDNRFPVSEQLLSKLPGVGSYTSRAIMVFAYRKDVAMVDTNIRQIINNSRNC
jgi:A/G-specific adenine glycosylase